VSASGNASWADGFAGATCGNVGGRRWERWSMSSASRAMRSPPPVDLTEEAWVAQNIIDQVEASCPRCGAVATYSKPDFYWR
jgi:hypothetical protein